MAEKADYTFDGVVTKPISIVALSRLLKLDKTNLSVVASSNNTFSVGGLCTHDNINIWAKQRPVRYNSITPITNAQRASVGCGLDIPTYTNLLALAEAIESGDANWTTQKPRGGAFKEYYRLSDFYDLENSIGYHHRADSDAGWYGWQGGQYETTGVFGCVIQRYSEVLRPRHTIFSRMDLDDTSSRFCIQFNDIAGYKPNELYPALGDWYYGLVLYHTQGIGANRIITTERTISTGMDGLDGNILRFNVNGLEDGEWNIVPILSCESTQGELRTVHNALSCVLGDTSKKMVCEYNSTADVINPMLRNYSNDSVSFYFDTELECADRVTLNKFYICAMHENVSSYDIFGSAEFDSDMQRFLKREIDTLKTNYYTDGILSVKCVHYTTYEGTFNAGTYKERTEIPMFTDGFGNELTQARANIIILTEYVYAGKTIRVPFYFYGIG